MYHNKSGDTKKQHFGWGGAYLHFTEVNGFKQFTEAWISNLFLYCFYVTNKPNRIAFWDGVARSHPLHFWESIHLITFLGKRCMVYLMSENHNCHSYLGLKSEVCHVRFEERQNRNNVEKELSASNTVRIMNFKWAIWSSQLRTQFKQLRIEAWKSQDFNVEVLTFSGFYTQLLKLRS